MKDLCIVILHYQFIEETKKAINYLLRLNIPDGYCQRIIVVDNGSTNNTAYELKTIFGERIILIKNKQNFGFAKGNNIGFSYAKEKFNPVFLILANNDTYIKDTFFWPKLISSYETKKFNIAGPRIISLKDQKDQNPEIRQYYCIGDIKKKKRKLILLNSLRIIGLDIIAQKAFVFLKSVKKTRKKDLIFPDDYQLFGAFLIFDIDYIEKYDGLEPITFMYGEENVLRYVIERDHLSMTYINDIVIYHAEGASTQKMYGAKNKKRKFYYENSIKSCNALIKYIIKYKTNNLNEGKI